MEVNIHQAKTTLSQLIMKAEAGEEVIIARAGKPVIRLVPVKSPKRTIFKPGALRGKLNLPENFFDPDPELETLLIHGPILSDEDISETLCLAKADDSN